MPDCLIRLFYRASLGAILLGHATVGLAQAPIIHPGAPGEAPRQLSAEEAIEIANTSHSPDDARFMQDMIPHHHQAIEMAALVADRYSAFPTQTWPLPATCWSPAATTASTCTGCRKTACRSF